jgi:N-acetylmuramoyl-L-alanine amidase
MVARRSVRRALSVVALVVAGCGSSQTSSTTSVAGILTAAASQRTAMTTGTAPASRRRHAVKPRPPLLASDTVAINPGHNGGDWDHPQIVNRLVPAGRGRVKACDTTGTSTDGGYSEAAFNLSVGLDLRELLVKAGAKVVMTRTTNDGVGPCVNVRAAIGNRAHARAVLSIHADGAPPNGRGFQILYPPDAGDTSPIYRQSLRLARAIHDALVRSRLLPPSNYAGRDGYVERDDLAGLNLSTRPAIFVELGNMRNATDGGLQTRSTFRAAIARALYNGLVRFLTRASR